MSQSSLGWVTITHPHHPLCGQQLEIVGLRRGAKPDLIIRLPDGSHAALAQRDTDYAWSSPPLAGSTHLLALEGLRQLAQFVDRQRQQGRLPPAPA